MRWPPPSWRALRVYERVSAAQAGRQHELEYVTYFWDDDGSLVLQARLASEDGTILVKALEAAPERIRKRRRQEKAETARAAEPFEPPRSDRVEALLELANQSLGRHGNHDRRVERAATERRAQEAPVPPKLRRAVEARDDYRCQWPGCSNRRYLDAHHRRHWAQGGETSLANLILLCWHHHRLVHEGGYTIENGPAGELRFRNRYGLLHPTIPRPPPGSADELVAQNGEAGLTITHKTNQNGYGDRMDLDDTIYALVNIIR